jgi:hypothetical protein
VICAECRHIGNLKRGQAFALCAYWAGTPDKGLVPDEWRGEEYAYVCLHCHVTPYQSACPAAERERCCA